MPPVIEEFWASYQAQCHMIVKHDVDFEEATEAAESTDRHHRTYSNTAGERRHIVPGKTASGRRLWVVFADEGEGSGRIITAREATGSKERSRHKRLRGE